MCGVMPALSASFSSLIISSIPQPVFCERRFIHTVVLYTIIFSTSSNCEHVSSMGLDRRGNGRMLSRLPVC